MDWIPLRTFRFTSHLTGTLHLSSVHLTGMQCGKPLFSEITALSCFHSCFYFRDLDSELASLKAAHEDLDLRNEMLMQANNELKAQMSVVSSFPPAHDDLPLGSNSASSLGGGMGVGTSSLTLSVNVVTNVPASTSSAVTTGTNTVGMATASIPIRFDSEYRRSMETGLQ